MADGRAPLPEADGPQLQVDFRERFYASGRLPPRADRREAAASERELLAARAVDRALRPLFPPGALYEVQVTATVLAADGGTDAAVAAVNAASAALAMSEAPWWGPAGAVRVAALRQGASSAAAAAAANGGGGGGKKDDDAWEILVDPPASACVGMPLPRRAGGAAPWPMLTPGPLLMAAAAAAALPSPAAAFASAGGGGGGGGGGGPGRPHPHSRHRPAPPPPTCGLLLTYAGTSSGDVLMLEAQGAPAPERVVIAALRRAADAAALLCVPQLELARRSGRPKARLPLVWPADDLSLAVEALARPSLEAVFSSRALAPAPSPLTGGGAGGGGGGWPAAAAAAAAPWQTAKERRAAALGQIHGRVLKGLEARGLLPDAHSLPSYAKGLYSVSDASRALDVLTGRVMREALLAGCGLGTGLVDAARSARPSAVVAPRLPTTATAPTAPPPPTVTATAAAGGEPSPGRRADGRLPTELRHVACEAGVLPRAVHGSALFDRGDTQCLAAATVAADRDAAAAEAPHGRAARRLMLHYSFPPFCVGETGRVMGAPPNRREVGHGALAERALAPLLPPAGAFPFCVRVAAETLGSSGSSSMAAVCAASLAMRAAGVPLSDDAAGVSVGLAYERPPQLGLAAGASDAGEAAKWYAGAGAGGGGAGGAGGGAAGGVAAAAAAAGRSAQVAPARPSSSAAAAAPDDHADHADAGDPYLPDHPLYGRGVLLTDIEGAEDHHGDMDLKIAGTMTNGVTAAQLDTKLPGVPLCAIERAFLGPALAARREILRRMRRAAKVARDRLPPRARPKIGGVSVSRELVPRLIGAAGCNLEAIEAATGGRLAVSETGEVDIYAPTAAQWDHAATAVLEVEGGSVVEGGVYRVTAIRVVDYGAFVELPNGMPALLHISELEHRRLRDVHEAVREGDAFDVLCLGRDAKGLVQLSRRALMPRPAAGAAEAAATGAGAGGAAAATAGVASGGGNGGGNGVGVDGSTQQSVWTLAAHEYTPEAAAAAAEAALGIEEEEEEQEEEEGEREGEGREDGRPFGGGGKRRRRPGPRPSPPSDAREE